MLRVLQFLIVAAVLLAIVWWVGGLPGDVVARVGQFTIETSTPAAILILVLIAAFLTIFFRVLGGLRGAPGRLGDWRFGRRRRQGDVAIQRAIVALAAGDLPAAKTQGAQARKLLGEAPLVLLVQAEAARLSGETEAARVGFETLTQHKDMAFLGYHGLIRHSLANGAHEQAHEHALAAADAYPGSPWLREKRREIAVKKADWPAALALTKAPQEVAALAAAAAGATEDPVLAMNYAKRAVKAAPASTAAVLAYAAALMKRGKPRAAQKALLAGWKAAPHPGIAAAFLSVHESPLARAKAAGELAVAAPGHGESELVLAQTARAAALPGEARRHALAAREAGIGDGRADAVLAQLDGLPAVPSRPVLWQCSACHGAQEAWAPACAQCGRIGTLVWNRPGTALAAAPATGIVQG